MAVLVEEWQKAIAKIPSHWVTDTAGFDLICANSPDGEDRMCVGWKIDRKANDGPVEVVHLVRSPSTSKDREHEFTRVGLWTWGGKLVGCEHTWHVHLARTRWHWWVAADGDRPEETGVCATRFDAIGAAYRVRWDRTMEKVKARAKALHSTN